MSQEALSILEQWEQVAAQLQAYRDSQRSTWGDLESAVLGRYLAGETDPSEQSRVEAELAAHPELRRLTDLVREVLDEFEPTAAPPAEEPVVVKFRAAARRPSWLERARRNGVLALAACVLVLLGVSLVPKLTPERDNHGTSAGLPPVKVVADVRGRAVQEGEQLVNEGLELLNAGRIPEAGVKLVAARDTHATLLPSNHPRVVQCDAYLNAWTDQVLQQKFKAPPSRSTSTLLTTGPRDRELTTLSAYFWNKDLPSPPPPVSPPMPRGIQRTDLRKVCVSYLGEMGPEGLTALTRMLARARTPKERAVVVEVFQRLGPQAEKAVPELERLARSQHQETRKAAQEALSHVRPVMAKPPPSR